MTSRRYTIQPSQHTREIEVDASRTVYYAKKIELAQRIVKAMENMDEDKKVLFEVIALAEEMLGETIKITRRGPA